MKDEIEKAVEKHNKELALELLWIQSNVGLKSKPWSEVSNDTRARYERIYDITIQAMKEAYDMGRDARTMDNITRLTSRDFG